MSGVNTSCLEGTDKLSPWTLKAKALCGPVGDWNLAAAALFFSLSAFMQRSVAPKPPHGPASNSLFCIHPVSLALLPSVKKADRLAPSCGGSNVLTLCSLGCIELSAAWPFLLPSTLISHFHPLISLQSQYWICFLVKKNKWLNQMFREDCNPFSRIWEMAPGPRWNSLAYINPTSSSLLPPILSSPPPFLTPSFSAATIQLYQMISPHGAHHSITQPNKKSKKTPMARWVVIFWGGQSIGWVHLAALLCTLQWYTPCTPQTAGIRALSALHLRNPAHP